MASNFKFSIYRNSENIHIKLFGDFDGTSAFELINFLKESTEAVSKIFVHTSCLKRILPLGRDVFLSNLDFLRGDSPLLLLTGDEASGLVPRNNKHIQALSC
ncbi:hypothetical protein BuS5_03655 [Desulfosarcina sp. BuS5]|uniref:hypothetical protein n=1 Tax=Desulfosarcina sp. BuS5 TaxID=933262 RepID=UPI000483099E|nr:hypothetical protein [Desulfosarcina sp. BuS5]WDN90684.1 hypothetical protein BuS5_03655 [Desulfosarcina sp. BuS5]